MLEAFRTMNFRGTSRQIIDTANDICREYQAQGYNLTLRQVYYQFVARGLLANKDTSYKRLGSIINDARLAGLMDWSYIQDRTRNVEGSFSGFTSPAQFIQAYSPHYNEAIWKGQLYRPEVWVEKDALKDIVAQACSDTRTPYFSCRGYVSQSEMYDAAKRFQRRVQSGLEPVVIHLGDHDPSGIDMSRDIEDRLSLMSWGPVRVERIALNMDQIERYNPPPNPTKLSDSRGSGYVERFGYSSWELDALEPRVLTSLIQDKVDEYIDRDLMDAALEHEQQQTNRLVELADRWEDLDTHWDDVLEVLG
jgi:hypothetical protein